MNASSFLSRWISSGFLSTLFDASLLDFEPLQGGSLFAGGVEFVPG